MPENGLTLTGLALFHCIRCYLVMFSTSEHDVCEQLRTDRTNPVSRAGVHCPISVELAYSPFICRAPISGCTC